MTGDELHDGAERRPVDRDDARSTKSKHSLPYSHAYVACVAEDLNRTHELCMLRRAVVLNNAH